MLKALVIGCGRVGSAIALQLHQEGWDVTVVDENEDALSRLGESWPGTFIVGHGMDADLLREAGIEDADAVVVATDGDNTNIIIGQVAQKRFDVRCVVVRVLDPGAREVLRGARPQHRVSDERGHRPAHGRRADVRDPGRAPSREEVVG